MFSSAFLLFFNRLLQSSTWASTALLPFASKSAQFIIPPFEFSFIVANDGTVIPLDPADSVSSPDVIIRLPADTAFLALSGLDKVMSEAAISGNAEFATALSFVMRNIRWDAEEDLSKFVGDIPARRAFSACNRLFAAQQELFQRIARNLAEYLTIETRTLASREDLHSFAESIGFLEANLQRLGRRVSALEP